MDDDKEFTVTIRMKPIEKTMKVKAGDEIQAEIEAVKKSRAPKDKIAEIRIECSNYWESDDHFDTDFYPVDDDMRANWD